MLMYIYNYFTVNSLPAHTDVASFTLIFKCEKCSFYNKLYSRLKNNSPLSKPHFAVHEHRFCLVMDIYKTISSANLILHSNTLTRIQESA